ncbi:MAG: division/cell wall cluster transcriptional repressor MraZ [Lactobacillales bacterium]|nr:division/cell wall cluster transcriptional repressor MraZ [Lactobacillales bacterium]
MFMGEYHHTIDDKGRLTIPAKIRYELGANFVVTRGLDNCLFIYPSSEWSKVIDKYKELPNTKDARKFMRFFLSGATVSDFDKQGRVNIASPLINYASLEKDCVIIGVNDHLEVWSKTNWDNFILENEDDLSDIADKLFSSDFYA